MFDFAWSEFALIGAVALVVIGPKDLPVAIRGLAKGVKKARALASEFQSHLDEVVREADLSDVREHVRDLKNLNVRGRIMKALDGDGALGKAVSPPPLGEQSVPSGPRALDAIPRSTSPAYAAPQSSADYAAGHMGDTTYGSAPAWQDTEQERAVESAPPELPPLIVRRILREQDRLHPPAILPPVRIIHSGHSVAPGAPSVAGGLSGVGLAGPASTEQTDTGAQGAEQGAPAPHDGTGSTAADQQA